jgi:hypothetical protein
MCKCIFKCICKYSMWIFLNLTRRRAALKMDPAVLSLESISWPSGRITSWCVWTLIHSSIFLKSHSRSLSVHTLSTGVSTLSAQGCPHSQHTGCPHSQQMVSTLSLNCDYSLRTRCLNFQYRMSTSQHMVSMLSALGVHNLSAGCPQSQSRVSTISTQSIHILTTGCHQGCPLSQNRVIVHNQYMVYHRSIALIKCRFSTVLEYVGCPLCQHGVSFFLYLFISGHAGKIYRVILTI